MRLMVMVIDRIYINFITYSGSIFVFRKINNREWQTVAHK